MKDLKTVGDLRRLLADVGDDVAIEVAATPDVNGWTQGILACLHREESVVVLGLTSDCTTEEEKKLVFTDNEGNVVRPV